LQPTNKKKIKTNYHPDYCYPESLLKFFRHNADMTTQTNSHCEKVLYGLLKQSFLDCFTSPASRQAGSQRLLLDG